MTLLFISLIPAIAAARYVLIFDSIKDAAKATVVFLVGYALLITLMVNISILVRSLMGA